MNEGCALAVSSTGHAATGTHGSWDAITRVADERPATGRSPAGSASGAAGRVRGAF